MPVEIVLDASAAVKCFIPEEGSEAVFAALLSMEWTIAPDFLHLEIASVAAKRLRRGDISPDVARRCVSNLRSVVNDFYPTEPLALRAFAFASDQGFSAYDGLYLALAEQRSSRVLTADTRLLRRAAETSFGHLVEPI